MKKYIVNFHFRLYVNREDIFFLFFFTVVISSLSFFIHYTFIHLDIHKLWHCEHLSFFIPYFFFCCYRWSLSPFFRDFIYIYCKGIWYSVGFLCRFFYLCYLWTIVFLYFFKNIQLVVIFFFVWYSIITLLMHYDFCFLKENKKFKKNENKIWKRLFKYKCNHLEKNRSFFYSLYMII